MRKNDCNRNQNSQENKENQSSLQQYAQHISLQKSMPMNQSNNQFFDSFFGCCISDHNKSINIQKTQQSSYYPLRKFNFLDQFPFKISIFNYDQTLASQEFLSQHPMRKNIELIKILNLNQIIKNKDGDLQLLAVSDTPLATVLLSKEKIIYQGRVLNNSANDKNGLVIYPDGSYFKGNIKYGIIQGQGIYKFDNQNFSYEGQWVNGMPNGFGKQIGPTGVYQGLFRNGKKWGNGKMTFPNNSIYMGSFIDNEISGSGTLYSQNSMAKGNWVNGFLQGVGTQKFSDNSQFLGQFHKGKPHGQGTFTLPNNKVYVGQFKNGKPIRQGKFYYNNKQYSQNWNKQQLLSISISVQQTISNSAGIVMGSFESHKTNSKNNSSQNSNIPNNKSYSISSFAKNSKRSISHRNQERSSKHQSTKE